MDDANTRVKALRDRLEKELLQRIPHAFVAGDLLKRLPNTANIAFGDIEGEGILHFLNREGVACSSGSACACGSQEPSHVLVAMNVPNSAAHGAIRFSFSRNNGEEDVDRVLEVMPGIVKKLRELSPSASQARGLQSAPGLGDKANPTTVSGPGECNAQLFR